MQTDPELRNAAYGTLTSSNSGGNLLNTDRELRFCHFYSACFVLPSRVPSMQFKEIGSFHVCVMPLECADGLRLLLDVPE